MKKFSVEVGICKNSVKVFFEDRNRNFRRKVFSFVSRFMSADGVCFCLLEFLEQRWIVIEVGGLFGPMSFVLRAYRIWEWLGPRVHEFRMRRYPLARQLLFEPSGACGRAQVSCQIERSLSGLIGAFSKWWELEWARNQLKRCTGGSISYPGKLILAQESHEYSSRFFLLPQDARV